MLCPDMKNKLAPSRFTTAKDHGTEASYRIAHCIAKHGKPFTDGEFIKEVNNGAL